jgi:hypothetical protein
MQLSGKRHMPTNPETCPLPFAAVREGRDRALKRFDDRPEGFTQHSNFIAAQV